MLVHGFTAPATAWVLTVDALLAAGHRVVAFDRRAHGESETPAHGQRMARHGRDLGELLEHLDLRDAVLVGASMGGNTVWAYVDQFGPSRLAGVVVVDQTPKMLNDDTWPHGFYGYDASNAATFFDHGVPQLDGGRTVDRSGAAVARLAERLGGFPAFRESTAPETLGLLRDHALQDWRDVVRRFPRPLLMLAGRESQVWSCEHAEAAVEPGRWPAARWSSRTPATRSASTSPTCSTRCCSASSPRSGRASGEARDPAARRGTAAGRPRPRPRRDGALWRGLIERVVAAGGTTVTTVDLRGHGASERADDYSIGAFADDLVETLPTGLDLVVGHSLGGTVLERAVARLAPAHALYLDPGFRLGLPTEGLTGRLFWGTAPVSVLAAGLVQKWRSRHRAEPSAEDLALREVAASRFEMRMAVGVFRDVAFHPVGVTAPAVPSTVVLSDDSPAVLPDEMAVRLEALGWDVRRLPGVGHDFWLEDADRTFAAVQDLLAVG